MAATDNQESPNPPQPDPAPAQPPRQYLPWLGVLLAFAALAGIWLGSYAFSPAPADQDTTVLIPKGAGVRQIRVILARQQLLADDVRFQMLALVTSSASRLRAGEYRIPPHATPLQILTLLKEGKMIR